MNKVLIVSWGFPPLLDAEGIQVARYVKYLGKYGWQPHVLTVHETSTSAKIDQYLMDLVPSNVKIEKAYSLESNIWINRLSYRIPLLLHLPNPKTLPDPQILWYWNACRVGKLVIERNGKFNIIYSRACPHTSNLVGLGLKRRTGLPWVAHFSDPWVDSPYFRDLGFLHRKINEKLEDLIVQHADGVTFASEYIKERFIKKYPYLYEKSFVVPNCFDESIMPIDTDRTLKSHKFTLTYTGKLYGIRTPVPLLKALKLIIEQSPHLSDILQVLIVGGLRAEYRNMIFDMELEKIVSVIEMVPYRESLEYMAKSDVLLLIDAPSEGPSIFLPSKLLEYVAAQKPILGITPLEGASADVIRAAGGIVVAPDDIDGIAKGIRQLYEKYENGDLILLPQDPSCIQSYDVKNTARHLAEIFARISGKSPI